MNEALLEFRLAAERRSVAVNRGNATRRTEDTYSVQSLLDMLRDLGTLCRNRLRIPELFLEFDRMTFTTPYQQHVLDLLGITMK